MKALNRIGVIFSIVITVMFAVLLWVSQALPSQPILLPPGDFQTGISSSSGLFLTPRYMRHLWIVRNPLPPYNTLFATLVQKNGTLAPGETPGLALYTCENWWSERPVWSYKLTIPGTENLVSDGIVVENNILVTCSAYYDSHQSDILYVHLSCDFSQYPWEWSIVEMSTVFSSNGVYGSASRATIARDISDTLWCAFRTKDATDNWYISVYLREDGNWFPSPDGFEFGSKNRHANKNAKILSFQDNTKIGLIYHDIDRTARTHKKRWAWRDESGWQETGTDIVVMERSPYTSHWSAASDTLGNIHLVQQEGMQSSASDPIYGISYLRYGFDENTQKWQWNGKQWISQGDAYCSHVYCSVTTSQVTNDVYVFRDTLFFHYWETENGETKFPYGNIYLYRGEYSPKSNTWEWDLEGKQIPRVETETHWGYLRMCTPETFSSFLPLIYMKQDSPESDILYNLITVGE